MACTCKIEEDAKDIYFWLRAVTGTTWKFYLGFNCAIIPTASGIVPWYFVGAASGSSWCWIITCCCSPHSQFSMFCSLILKPYLEEQMDILEWNCNWWNLKAIQFMHKACIAMQRPISKVKKAGRHGRRVKVYIKRDKEDRDSAYPFNYGLVLWERRENGERLLPLPCSFILKPDL